MEPASESTLPLPPPLEFEPEPAPPGLWERVGDVHPGFTYALIVLILAAFAAELVTATATAGDLFAGGSLLGPLIEAGAAQRTAFLAGEWWRALSCVFLHANLLHVGANLATLAVVGGVAERIYGHARFLVLFTLAALAGSVGTFAHQGVLAHPAGADALAAAANGVNLGSIGASGAVYGVWAAVVVGVFRMRGLLPPWRVRALIGVTLPLLAVSVVGGMTRPGTDNAAHVAGAAAGLVLGFILPFHPALPGRPEPGLARAAWAGLGLLGFGTLVASGVVAFAHGMGVW